MIGTRAELKGETTSALDARRLRKDGSLVDVSLWTSPLRDSKGEVIGILGLYADITARKQSEEALKQSEERFRQVAETAGEFIWEVDAKGLYTYASPSVKKLLGYTPEELVGKKHFYDLFMPFVRDELKAAAFQVFADRQTFRGFPNANVSKSGEIVHLETSGTPVLDSAGNLVGYRGVDTDVTARLQAHERLEERVRERTAELVKANEALRYLAAIVESSDDAILSGDLDGIITSWNAGAQRLYNYASEEIMGRPITVLVPRNRRGELREILKKLRCGEHIRRYETVRLKKGGIPVEVSITVSPVRNGEGQVIGVSAIARDITERKQAEEALQKSEEQYRALVETTDTGFVILDRAGRVLDANAEYVRLIGHRDVDEIRGKSVVEWTAGPDKERNAEAVRTCLKNGYVRNLEIGHVDSHGKVTPIEINATVEKTRGSLRIVTLCRDITERKDLEQAVVEASSREQQRIGQDLHDGVCQQLTGIGFLWQAVAQSVAARTVPDAAAVAEIGRLITKTIGETRDLACGLCPVELQSNDLDVALKNLGLLTERLFAISCVVRCPQPVRLADKVVATHLYRIAQEAIGNAIRHGKAARVWIHLVWKKNGLRFGSGTTARGSRRDEASRKASGCAA